VAVLAVYTGSVTRLSPDGAPIAVDGFGLVFPMILARIADGRRITIGVESLARSHVDVHHFADNVLRVLNVPYVLARSPRTLQGEDGILFFECPVHGLDQVVRYCFNGFMTEIQGFVSDTMVLDWLIKAYCGDATEIEIDRFVQTIACGFKVWTDNDGMTLRSLTLDRKSLEERIDIPSLDAVLAGRAND
jgi:hypothetical protein